MTIADLIQDRVAQCMTMGVKPDEVFVGPEELKELLAFCNIGPQDTAAFANAKTEDGIARFRGMIVRHLLNPGVRVGATF